MDLGLKGKRALVTGGSRGIGRAIVLGLAQEGVDISLAYVKNEAKANEVCESVHALGGQCIAIRADVSKFDEAKRLVERSTRSLGGLDILVCNAGVNRDKVIWKMAEEQWDEVILTNLKGYFNCLRNAAPLMKEQRRGRVVMLTSINGLRGKFGQCNYSASKAGIIGLMKSAAKELGGFGVTVNAVAPGLVETEMIATMPEEFKVKAREETVLGRIATPEDVANVVVFLSSDAARHITGEVVKVDGGQYI